MGISWASPDVAADLVRQARALTDGVFQVNFALHFPPVGLEAALEAGVPCVTFSWGDAAPFVDKVRSRGAGLGVQVVSAEGARHAVNLEPDFIICQGMEAGGHVQSSSPLADLLPRVVEVANGLPVIAAGGIGDASAIRKMLDLGATGVMLGTRFVATQESRAHPLYKNLLVERTETALTVCFDGDWPYAAQRVIRNSTLETWEAVGSPPVGKRPGEHEVIAHRPDGSEVLRYSDSTPQQGMSGEVEAMCLYAGTSVAAIEDLPSAGSLVARLWQEALALDAK